MKQHLALTRKHIKWIVLILVLAGAVAGGVAVKFRVSDYYKGRHFQALQVELKDQIKELENETHRLEEQARGLAPEKQMAALSICGDAHLLYKQYLEEKKKPIPTKVADIRKGLADIRAAWKRFADQGEDPLATRRGAILTGYISPIDDSIQYFSVNVPADYSGDRAWPLYVRLHGHGWYQEFQGHPSPGFVGALTVSPFGRGPSDYMWIGETDVLAVLAHVKAYYHIDDRRVYVYGNSMGGTGSWNLAVHYPDVFAAIAPQAGNADDRAWTERWGWNTTPLSTHTEIRQYMTQINSPTTFAENLLHVPAFCVHGSGDMVVPVDHARLMIGRLRDELHYDVVYYEFPNSGHGNFPDYMESLRLGYMGAHNQPPAPESHIVYTAAKLRHGRAYWVTMEQFEQPMAIGRIDAELVAANRIRIRTENLLRLSVDLSSGLADPEANLAIAIDGREAYSQVPGPVDRLHFAKSLDGTWAVEPSGRPNGLAKVRGVEGPVDEIFLDPFMLVYGTGGDDKETLAAIKAEVDALAGQWTAHYGHVRVKADTDVTAEDMTQFNLVLFGRPSNNSIYNQLADRLPIQVDDKRIQIGKRSFTADDTGAIFCYPNPLQPDRLVAVYTALKPGGFYQMHGRFGNWFNWGIYDNRKWFDFAVFDSRSHDPETYLAVGFFGADWTLESGRLFEGMEHLREASAAQHVPRFATAADAAGQEAAYLSDIHPTAIDQMRGAVGFDRSFRGYPIAIGPQVYEHGLGVRVPSAITWELDGKFRTLSAAVGLQSEMDVVMTAERTHGLTTTFVVEGDGKALWTSKEFTDLKPGPQTLEVDISKVKKLTLRVKSAGPLWLHGSSSWAEAKITR